MNESFAKAKIAFEEQYVQNQRFWYDIILNLSAWYAYNRIYKF